MPRRQPLFSRPHNISEHAIKRFRERVTNEDATTVRLTLEGVVQFGQKIAPGHFMGQYRGQKYVAVLRRDPGNKRSIVTTVYVPS